MQKNEPIISVCLVVFNEEDLIVRCLESVRDLTDDIVVVHDGPCKDKTLEIATQYGARVFEQPHIGIAEPHRSFTYKEARGEWILQLDADEYLNVEDHDTIRTMVRKKDVSGYEFQWELWNGTRAIRYKGLQKLCLFKTKDTTFQGVPQTQVAIDGKVEKTSLILHHRPRYSNVSWKTAKKKRAYWLQAHVPYFFPEEVTYQCFQTDASSWISYTKYVRKHPLLHIVWYPFKNMLGQLKNGSLFHPIGWRIVLQQYIYYLALYYSVWKRNK